MPDARGPDRPVFGLDPDDVASLTVEDVATLWNVHPQTVRAMIHAKPPRLEARKVGRLLRITPRAVREAQLTFVPVDSPGPPGVSSDGGDAAADGGAPAAAPIPATGDRRKGDRRRPVVPEGSELP